MMRSVFTKTLYDLRWTMLAFCIGLALLAFFVVFIYPSVSDASGGLFSGLDDQMADALLGNLALANSPAGYLNVQLIPFQPLFIAVFIIIVTSAAVAGEDDGKTLGVLLTRPVPRWRILVEKAAAVTLATLVIIGALAAGAVIGAIIADVDISYVDLALAILMTVPFAVFLLGFGLFCSAVFSGRLVASLIATGLVVFSYMFNSSTEFVTNLETYNRFLPFYYYSWGQPLIGSIRWDNAAVLVGAGLLFFALSLFAFNRREVMA